MDEDQGQGQIKDNKTIQHGRDSNTYQMIVSMYGCINTVYKTYSQQAFRENACKENVYCQTQFMDYR